MLLDRGISTPSSECERDLGAVKDCAGVADPGGISEVWEPVLFPNQLSRGVGTGGSAHPCRNAWGASRLSAPQMCAQEPPGSGEMGSRQRQRRGSAVLALFPPRAASPARDAAGGTRARVTPGRYSQGRSSRGLRTPHPGPWGHAGHLRGLPGALCFLSQRKHFGEFSLAGEAARRAEGRLCKVPGPPHPSRPPRRISGVPVQRGLGLGQSWGERGCVGAALVPQGNAQSERAPLSF